MDETPTPTPASEGQPLQAFWTVAAVLLTTVLGYVVTTQVVAPRLEPDGLTPLRVGQLMAVAAVAGTWVLALLLLLVPQVVRRLVERR
jgi:uncharacterized membrane protein YhaH (DUF805 family)